MPPPCPEVPAGPFAVLAVDDDPLVLRFMQEALQRNGFRVIAARNGREALEELERCGGEVDLLVSDVIMPVMDGLTLAREVARTRPELPVLFVSGYFSGRDELQGAPGLLRLEVLPKPFSSELLIGRVKRLLPDRGDFPSTSD
jgi:two-component system cell cycle sensor histidine kinase/response regulator CckA